MLKAIVWCPEMTSFNSCDITN